MKCVSTNLNEDMSATVFKAFRRFRQSPRIDLHVCLHFIATIVSPTLNFKIN